MLLFPNLQFKMLILFCATHFAACKPVLGGAGIHLFWGLRLPYLSRDALRHWVFHTTTIGTVCTPISNGMHHVKLCSGKKQRQCIEVTLPLGSSSVPLRCCSSTSFHGHAKRFSDLQVLKLPLYIKPHSSTLHGNNLLARSPALLLHKKPFLYQSRTTLWCKVRKNRHESAKLHLTLMPPYLFWRLLLDCGSAFTFSTTQHGRSSSKCYDAGPSFSGFPK
jgi:hypothetical protein